MASKGNFPDFYVKKRQREKRLVAIKNIVIIVLVFVVSIGLGVVVFYTWFEPMRNKSNEPAQLAEERTQLETEQRIADASNTAVTPLDPVSTEENSPIVENEDQTVDTVPVDGMGSVDLADYAYQPSFPLVKVSLESGTGVMPEDEREDTEASTDQPLTNDDDPHIIPETPAEKPEESTPQPKPDSNNKPEETTSTTPDNTKAIEEEPKQPVEEPAEPAAGSVTYQYRVYAGSFESRDAAEQAKTELAAHSLNGQIIYLEPHYNVLVAVLEDYDAALALQNKIVNSGFTFAFISRKVKGK